MITLVARYRARPGHGDEIAAALHAMAPLVAAHEPGCAQYQASRSQDDGDVFLLYEQYEDETALARHRETPHFKELIEGRCVPLLLSRERELYTLEVS